MRMRKEDGCTKIATAHHRDDNVETVLLNIARGTGVQGLCGIWPAKDGWIRPLLYLERTDIEAFLKEQHISWRTDRTNGEDAYTRNRIRHHVIPALREQVNTGSVRHIDELSVQAREVWEYLEAGTDQAWERCVTGGYPGAERLCIRVEALLQEPAAVQKQLIKRCIACVLGGGKDIGAVHVADVLGLAGKQSGKRILLPGNAEAERIYGEIRLGKSPGGRDAADGSPDTAAGAKDAQKAGAAEPPGAEELSGAIELAVPGKTALPGFGMEIESCFVEDFSVGYARDIPQKSYTKWMDYDIIKHGLSVRTRRSGDYLTVDAAGRRQKLKSYLINEKIPRDMRDRLPLIADGHHIVWIPGYRMSSAYQLTDRTKKVLEIKITEEEEHVRDSQGTHPGGES